MRKPGNAPDDEWYTYYEDIESEINTMRSYVTGRNIYCSCDTINSNFVKYFKDNFVELGINRLSWSHIDYSIIYEFDGVSIKEIPIMVGDCRAWYVIDYCVVNNCLVITNPPFSLITSYLKDLIVNDLDFIIICPMFNFTTKILLEAYLNNKVKIGNRIDRFFNNDRGEKKVYCRWVNSFMDTVLYDYDFYELREMVEDTDYLKLKIDGCELLKLNSKKFPIDYDGYIILLSTYSEFKRLDGYEYFILRDKFKNRSLANIMSDRLVVKHLKGGEGHENVC